ncbi:MAG: efflux RND transporter permease subunit, partial [Endomicrobiales bacterium]|nr:efflux RND transporter permease subunit [Endomicrobiales bacterium]
EKPVTTLMIFIGLSLLGFISWTRLPQELFPSLEYPQITVVTKYEGAGPEEAEKLISKVVEEAVGTVKNVKKVTSVSKEGVSIVTCEFSWGSNMDFASMEVREKIDLVKQALPREAQEPIVLKYNPFQMEALILSVSYTEKDVNAWKLAELRYFCKKNIKDELERLDGVAKIEIRGGEKKEVLVEIDKGRLIANQISLMDVINSIRNANVTYPAGVIKEELYEYLVKTVGEFQNIRDIASLSFVKDDRSQPERRSRRIRDEDAHAKKKKIIFVKDIADVRIALQDKQGYSRYNLKDNISLGVYPQSGSNLIKISDAVKKKLEDLKLSFPNNIEIKIIYDQAEFIKTSLNNIYSSAVMGGVLAFIILFLFLKSIVASIIVTTSIPIALLMALSLMYFGDLSVNTMSLGGLALGVGMLVDNSIVVLENIFTTFQKNPHLQKKELIYQSTTQVVAPIISSTLTTVAIFLPFIFVTGVAGQLFKELALTVTFSLMASIFVAIFLVPRLALGLDLTKLSALATKDEALEQSGNNSDTENTNANPSPDTGKSKFDFQSYFKSKLKIVVNWPLKRMLIIIGSYLFGGLIAVYFIPKEFMPKMDERRFVLNITMHPKTPLEITNDVTKHIESLIAAFPEIKDIAVTIGSTTEEGGAGAISSLGSYQSRILARLKKKGRSTKEIVSLLSADITKWGKEDLETEFITQQGMFGSQIGSSAGIIVEVKGKDLKLLRQRSLEIKDKLEKIPEVYSIKIDPSDLVPELKLQIDRERASLFGLSTQDISAMALAAIKGYVATVLKQKDDEFDIRVRLRPEDRSSLEKIGEMIAYSPWGMTIQLKQISNINFFESLPEIRRIEGERTYFVKADVTENFNEVIKKLDTILKNLPPLEEIKCVITGEMLALKESAQSSVFALVLGIIVIYMILASQFESLAQPLIIMVTVPLGLIGGVYMLLFSFQSINSISMLGFLMLTGIVVNNGIILVDRFNEIRDKNTTMPLKEIVISCTSERLRPILMTTLTTILGLIPLALGIGEGSESTAPMAITVIGGLAFSVVLTLFFVPTVYLLSQQISIKKEPQQETVTNSESKTPQ